MTNIVEMNRFQKKPDPAPGIAVSPRGDSGSGALPNLAGAAPIRPMQDAPKDGTIIVSIDHDGFMDRVWWSDTRYCMLGAPQGSAGPGWLSIEAGNLPVDESMGWLPDSGDIS